MTFRIPEAAHELNAEMNSRLTRSYSPEAFDDDLRFLTARLESMTEAERAAYWFLCDLRAAHFREWKEAAIESSPAARAFHGWLDQAGFEPGETIRQYAARTGADLGEILVIFPFPPGAADVPLG